MFAQLQSIESRNSREAFSATVDLPQVYFVNQKKVGKGKLGKGKAKLFHADLLQMTKQTWGKSSATAKPNLSQKVPRIKQLLP